MRKETRHYLFLIVSEWKREHLAPRRLIVKGSSNLPARLVDEITHKILAEQTSTNTCILGPFYRADAPRYENGDSIIQKYLGGEVTWYHGRILDADSGKPVAGE